MPLSSKTSFTLEIANDEGMDGAPNSANTNLSCCAALMPPKNPGEYDTIADGLKKVTLPKSNLGYFSLELTGHIILTKYVQTKHRIIEGTLTY